MGAHKGPHLPHHQLSSGKFLGTEGSASRQEITQICSPGHKDLGVQPTAALRSGDFYVLSVTFPSQATLHCNADYFFSLQGQSSTLPFLEECVNNLPWGDEKSL